MEEKQRAINAAQMVKEFCTQQGVCLYCPFYIKTVRICAITDGCTPEDWVLPEALEAPQEQPAEPCQDVKEIKPDNVNHPGHYTAGGVECIDAIEAATVNLTGIEAVCTGNVIKYSWRWKLKNGVEDLKKAAWYLHKLIKRLDPTWRAE